MNCYWCRMVSNCSRCLYLYPTDTIKEFLVTRTSKIFLFTWTVKELLVTWTVIFEQKLFGQFILFLVFLVLPRRFGWFILHQIYKPREKTKFILQARAEELVSLNMLTASRIERKISFTSNVSQLSSIYAPLLTGVLKDDVIVVESVILNYLV